MLWGNTWKYQGSLLDYPNHEIRRKPETKKLIQFRPSRAFTRATDEPLLLAAAASACLAVRLSTAGAKAPVKHSVAGTTRA